MRAEYGTAIEQSLVGDSNSNGRVERAVQELKGLTRTFRSAVSAMIQQLVRLADPLVPWMVRHAAHIINVCRVRPDGRTAWQAMKGQRTSSKLLPFAETVLFKIPKTHHRIGSFENRWEIGCWVEWLQDRENNSLQHPQASIRSAPSGDDLQITDGFPSLS